MKIAKHTSVIIHRKLLKTVKKCFSPLLQASNMNPMELSADPHMHQRHLDTWHVV